MPKRDIARHTIHGHGAPLEMGGDADIPDQLAMLYETLSDVRGQLHELERLLFEVRQEMGLEPVPDWRHYPPESV